MAEELKRKSFLDDFVEATMKIDGFDIDRSSKPTIKYNDLNVAEIYRCFLDDNLQMIAEKLECPCSPPKDLRMLQDTFAYLFTLKDGQKFELNKKENKIIPHVEGKYVEC